MSHTYVNVLSGIFTGLVLGLVAAGVFIYRQQRTIQSLRFACNTLNHRYQIIQVNDLKLFSPNGGTSWYNFRWSETEGVDILGQAHEATVTFALAQRARNERLAGLRAMLERRQRRGRLIAVTTDQLIAEFEGTGITFGDPATD